MKSNINNSNNSNTQNLQTLDRHELATIDGGKTVILDGATVEMSDTTIAMMINSGAVKRVVVQHPLGAANPF